MHRNSLEAVYRALGLPERSCFPLITVVLGSVKEPPAMKKGRLPIDYVVHRETYKKPGDKELEGMITSYDDRSLRIHMMDDWKAQGFNHYLEWFFTKWCSPPAIGAPLSDKAREMQQCLRAAGFWKD